jgi:hypothetical protein
LSTTNPTGLTWARTQAVAVRGRRLAAWSMARPYFVKVAFSRWKVYPPFDHIMILIWIIYESRHKWKSSSNLSSK